LTVAKNDLAAFYVAPIGLHLSHCEMPKMPGFKGTLKLIKKVVAANAFNLAAKISGCD
jgi:hypothetical protein